MRVGVVGAGISGLLCAQRLTELAPTVRITVLEWGRGPGGRTARRRVTAEPREGGGAAAELSFDHAAPYFSATTEAFREILAQWQAAGVATPWPEAGEGAWVGSPSNNAIARHLVTELEQTGAATVRFGNHVLTAQHRGTEWHVRTQDRASDSTVELIFDALVLSDKLLILPNTYAVLAPDDVGAVALPSTLASTGCIVLLIALLRTEAVVSALPHPPETATVDYSRTTDAGGGGGGGRGVQDGSIIARVIHDSAKPGRAAAEEYDQWVVHSTAEYAAAHLVGESLDDEAAVLAELQAAFFGTAGGADSGGDEPAAAAAADATLLDSAVVHASVMAWDHAQTAQGSRVADAAYHLDTARGVGVCGDFFGEGVEGVEAAALSGSALAEALALQCLHVQKGEL